MIYLAHPTSAIAACESEPRARHREAQGYVRCTVAEYRWLWKRKDRLAGYALWLKLAAERTRQTQTETAPLKAKAVG